jgi:hypothetical protein
MKKMALQLILSIGLLLMSAGISIAQCSLCTKTASQLGEKPALGLNQGILYLMLAPFAVIGIIAYRWWKNNQ